MKILNFVFGILISGNAFGWGQYGHETVNQTAIDLLSPSDSIGACFQNPAARYLMTRYAVTPDIEWKTDMQIKTLSPEDAKARHQDDCYEHPLHFFEADAFVAPNSDPNLLFKSFSAESLSGDYRQTAFKEYSKMMAANINYILQVQASKPIEDKTNPSAKDVVLHGTAPWRARSLYMAAIEAMKKKDFQLAALYLGTMGHYIGDMSQPFHATLNFDGGYPSDAKTAGIHHEIDTGLFETMWTSSEKKKHTEKDENDVYASFDGTKAGVQTSAKAEFSQLPTEVNEQNIVSVMMDRLVASGYPLIETYLSAYQVQCQDANATLVSQNAKHRSVASKNKNPSDTPAQPKSEKPYCTELPGKKEGSTTVRDIGVARERKLFAYSVPPVMKDALEARLGKSSALLAKLWISAWKAANQPSFGDCSTWKFDQSYAIKNYLKPDYYPTGFDGITKPRCSEREPSSTKKKGK